MLVGYALDLLFSMPLAMRPPGPIEVSIIIVFVILPLHFLPTIIAFSKNTENKNTIFLLNLFLGWTFVFWVITLVMALSHKKAETQSE